MADPIDEKAGATPEEPPQEPRPDDAATAAGSEPAGDTPPVTGRPAAEPASTAVPAPEAATPDPAPEAATTAPASEAATAAYAAPPAAAGPAGTPPPQSWYRRRWAIITGAVVAGVVLFLGGMAIGTTIDGDNDFSRHAGPGMLGNGDGPGSGQQGPGLDQDGDSWGHDDLDERGFSEPSAPQAPGATPSPSSSASPSTGQGL